MILKIVILLVIILLFLIFAILFSPIFLLFNSRNKEDPGAVLSIHIIHPRIIKITYNFLSKQYDALFFSRIRFPRKEAVRESASSAPENLKEPAEQATAAEPEHDIQEHVTGSPENHFPKQDQEFETGAVHEENAIINKDNDKTEDIRHDTQPEDADNPEKPDRDEKTAKRSKFEKFKVVLRFTLNQKRIALKALQWIRGVIFRLFALVGFEAVYVRLKAGFDDPALTGLVHGFYTSIFYGFDLDDVKRVTLEFEPVFENRDTFDFSGTLSIKTSVARLLMPLIFAILTFPYISAFILWRRIRRMKRALED